ncbi:DUF4296 domain-containing protein [Marivirga sp. S37H4]|uniref:DUF4296 domain-containing protein n=1 Tax=Marivirga aurantiaca TaxID=2802615 RepID=A0A934WWG3_9BACT|nr:DUF4296 domain-containing protein [Marivirga aurantiaca]MBK6264150.1 DUF4296 domain-containing protein [Marivirga aurantiaca]
MRNLSYLVAILIIVSCTQKNEVPKGVLPPEKMANILSEIYIAENKVSNIGLRHDSSKVVMRHYELKIFDDNNTTDSIYKESFAYYLENPTKLEAVYDIVIDSMSLKEQVIEANRKKALTKDKTAI